MSFKDWESFVKELSLKKYDRENKKEVVVKKLFKGVFAILSIEIVIGVIAAFFVYYIFGAKELLKMCLSWIIGITFIATIVTAFMNWYHKKVG